MPFLETFLLNQYTRVHQKQTVKGNLFKVGKKTEHICNS